MSFLPQKKMEATPSIPGKKQGREGEFKFVEINKEIYLYYRYNNAWYRVKLQKA